MKSKKIYIDMILNLMAAGLPLLVLQVIIYPLASRKMNADTYGLMIAIYSLMLLVNDSLGKSLNNIRLIRNNEKDNKKGDYNLVLIVYVFISVIVTAAGVVYYSEAIDVLSIGLLLLASAFILVNAYTIVFYRIRLNYIAIVINAFFTTAGFLFGYYLYSMTDVWAWIFVCAQFSSFMYLTITTKLLKEPLKKTENFKQLVVDSSALSFSLLLSQGMSQVDKLLLFPLLGGATLSVYYTASLMGKLMSLATGPVNSVILSYLAGKDHMAKKTFKRYVIICFVTCLAMAIVILLISRPVLSFLFPKFVDEAMKIVPLTTLNIFIFVMAGMITPIVMKYCDMYWQLIINGTGFVIYVVSSIVMLKLFGLVGFCLGIGFSHLIRLMLLFFVYNKKSVNAC